MSRISSPVEQNSTADNIISLMNLVPRGHKLYHLFNFISQNYGNSPEDIIRAISTILDFDKGLKSFFNGKRFTAMNIFNLFRYSLPASLYGIEMALKIKKYINKIKKKDLSEYARKQEKFLNFLGLKSEQDLQYLESLYMNEDIIFWLLKSPKTKGYEILGYYNNSYELLGTVSFESEYNVIYILIEHNNKKILFDLKITKMLTTYYCTLQYVLDCSSSSEEIIKDLESLIIKDFILTFKTQNNILEYNGSIRSKERAKIEEKINQYDVVSLEREIREVLKSKRKRGYSFIGLQGTGKSIIIKKLEEDLTDITIIKLGTEEFFNPYRIKKCFHFIRIIQPALVIIEDLDALGFREKNERVHAFINEIDDSNNNLNIVLVVTINDTEMVHKTIIDRPGRFDEIIEIKPPQSEDEVYEVMLSKFNKLKHFYTKLKNSLFPSQKDIVELLHRCLKNRFTQAELTCGIIEKVFINIKDPEHPCLYTEIEKAVDFFEKSKKSLKTYSFSKGVEKEECLEVTAIEEDCPTKLGRAM